MLLILLIAQACNIFSTRDSELPTTPSNSLIPATTPVILFNNFKSSIEEKVLENYLSCFVDQSFLQKKFLFTPSSGSSSLYPVLVSWGIDSERQYFNNLKTASLPGNTIAVKFSNQVNNPLGDSAIYQLDYTLTVQGKDQNLSGEYSGTSQFKIYRDSRNQWVIVGWEDIKVGSKRTWSELKGRLY